MRNLRPEQIDGRASKALDAASPQRLRASLNTIRHKQRRSTNHPRLKSSAGKGKPGQHNKQSNSHHPAFQQTNPLLAPNQTTAPTPCNKEAPPLGGYLHSPTHQHRPKRHHHNNELLQMPPAQKLPNKMDDNTPKTPANTQHETNT